VNGGNDVAATKPVVVVGDGWSALFAVAHLLTQERSKETYSGAEILWVAGNPIHLLSPLPSFETGFGSEAVESWIRLATLLGVELGQTHSGTFLREFKNKGFREATWASSEPKLEDVETRAQEREETLWGPEQNVAQLFETRFDLSAAEIEEVVRLRLVSGEFKSLRRIEANALAGVSIEDGQVAAVTLASGEEFECSSVIFADRWNQLPKIRGLPKAIAFTRKREAHGVLQATFNHVIPVGVGVLEGFFGTMNREAGEEFDRHCWGYFSSDGTQSHWTLCLTVDEAEDNHEIAKKLRRMKSTLDKMFTGTSWVPNPEQGFMANVRDEQVRFEESLMFSDRNVPAEILHVSTASNMSFVTDGYGPTRAFEQVTRILGPVHHVESTSEVDDSDRSHTQVQVSPTAHT
jgi:hypothetical protein